MFFIINNYKIISIMISIIKHDYNGKSVSYYKLSKPFQDMKYDVYDMFFNP